MTIREDLEPLPARLRNLPINDHGYPVPWFVAWVPGPEGRDVPEFRAVDARKFRQAVKSRLCWICGQPLGAWLAFPIGSMCVITRAIAEPPSHRECAEWSIRNCPFLSNPEMTRRHDQMPADVIEAAGVPIQRNPGVVCLWMTRSYEVFDDGNGRPMITIGAPSDVTWWRLKRRATRAEVEASIASGLPILLNAARRDGRFAVEALERAYESAKTLWPPPEGNR